MRVPFLLAAGLALIPLAACGDGPTADSEDVPAAVGQAEEAPLPSNDLGNTYPSQTGTQAPVAPGAEGGRGSAATGETPLGQSGTENQQQQQTTP